MLHQQNWDDLHKEAAEKYPLNTGNANWKAVEKLLKSDDNAEPEILSKKRYAIFFTLLALITTSSIGYLLIAHDDNVDKVSTAVIKPGDNHNKNIGDNKSVTITTTAASPVIKSTTSSESLITNASFISNKHVISLPVQSASNQSITATNEILMPRKPEEAITVLTDNSSNILSTELQNQQTSFSLTSTPLQPDKALSITDKNQVRPIKLKLKSKFYAGLYLSREISYVRTYHISQGSIGYGFLLGFNINRHLSIETGVSKQKKNFATTGDNFSKDNLRLRPTTKLTEVNGYFMTTDIPVNVRYNFNEGKRGQFFATTGLSTLVLHRQYYDYHVEKEEGPEILQRSYPAIKKDNKMFSQLNVSAGYEKNIGKVAQLRIEPYYQLPLSNIGLGKVRLSTAGVNVGIVKRF